VSEPERIAKRLARAGLWFSLLSGLSYFSYYYFTGLALEGQANLANKPIEDATALAPSIIKSFTAFYKKEEDPSVTLAAFDLSKIELMTSQLDMLSNAMIAAMPKSFKSIGKARSYAAEYASGDTDISAIDLGYFADSLVTAGAGLGMMMPGMIREAMSAGAPPSPPPSASP
jgi:hypothetical protein